MKTDRIYLVLYGLYFLLLAVAWHIAPEAWRGLIFFVTYASASIAIVTLGYLIDSKQSAGH
jgi:hypothetical protein